MPPKGSWEVHRESRCRSVSPLPDEILPVPLAATDWYFFRWQYTQEGHGAITLRLSRERETLPTSKAEFQSWLLLLAV